MGIPSPTTRRTEPNNTAPSTLCIIKHIIAESVIIEAKITGLFHAFLRERTSKTVKSLNVGESKTTLVSML